jgi:anionic cell wall polymer biosynthesis LytR-Cps2A-Psr (LCP) family protein
MGVIELPKKKIVFIFFSFLLVCIISGATYFYCSYQSIKEDNENITSYRDEGENTGVENLELENGKEYKEIKGITNILLLGIDDRGTLEPVRADTIMILTLDDNNKKMKLTSIMRDTYVEIPGHGYEKINHAFAYGGINLMAQTIEKSFNISLTQYVKINFDGFKDLADSVGGLDVKIRNYEEVNELNRCILLEIYDNPKSDLEKVKSITDSAGLLGLREEGATLIKNNPRLTKSQYNYIFETAGFVEDIGDVHLNGSQLLAYSRMRHVGEGDFERNERQRAVVNLLTAKLKDTPQFKYLSIANKLLPYVKTNIGLTDALNLAYTTYKTSNFAVEQLQMPTTKLSDGRIYKNKGWVLLMDKEQNSKILKEFIFENIKYDEAKYSAFNYKNSEYYYEAPVAKAPSNELLNGNEDKINNSETPKKVLKDTKADVNATNKPTEDDKKQKVEEGLKKESAESTEKIETGEPVNLEDDGVDLDLQDFKDVNDGE